VLVPAVVTLKGLGAAERDMIYVPTRGAGAYGQQQVPEWARRGVAPCGRTLAIISRPFQGDYWGNGVWWGCWGVWSTGVEDPLKNV